MLFIGARTPGELPYFGPLMKLPHALIDVNLAFSGVPGEPKAYVQDRIRTRAEDVAALLRSGHRLHRPLLRLCDGGHRGVVRHGADQWLVPPEHGPWRRHALRAHRPRRRGAAEAGRGDGMPSFRGDWVCAFVDTASMRAIPVPGVLAERARAYCDRCLADGFDPSATAARGP